MRTEPFCGKREQGTKPGKSIECQQGNNDRVGMQGLYFVFNNVMKWWGNWTVQSISFRGPILFYGLLKKGFKKGSGANGYPLGMSKPNTDIYLEKQSAVHPKRAESVASSRAESVEEDSVEEALQKRLEAEGLAAEWNRAQKNIHQVKPKGKLWKHKPTKHS
jgi:hypothetical protein